MTLYGYYMFHGGTNPDGKQTTLQESQATGYPQDLPVKAYDFQAPLGEFGQMRRILPRPEERSTCSCRISERTLAPMTAYFPAKMPSGKLDRDTPRVAVRAGAAGAFVFLNSYQKDHPLPRQNGFPGAGQACCMAPSPCRASRSTCPAARIRSGRWICRLAARCWNTPLPAAVQAGEPRYAWCSSPGPGWRPSLCFGIATAVAIEAPEGRIERAQGAVYISGLRPGPGSAIRIRDGSGHVTQIVLLSREQARNLWKAPLAGRERLIFLPPACISTPAGFTWRLPIRHC